MEVKKNKKERWYMTNKPEYKPLEWGFVLSNA